MYKVIGADGKEYGPIGLDQLKAWVSQGRVNAQSRVREEGGGEWITAWGIPELQTIFTASSASATVAGGAQAPAVGQASGLAITSLILGILSLVCFGFVTGIPAIICGHIAYSRARRSPQTYGGSGLAVAGFVLGYVGFFMTFILVALFLPALSRAKERAQSIQCANQMKQIGLAFKTWALDHNGQYPFNVSTNSGGTLELCSPGPDGFDRNAAVHFSVLSNELSSPFILVCPGDRTKQRAFTWHNLQSINVSYQLRTGSNVNESHPDQVLAVCPIHGGVIHSDGSVEQRPRARRSEPENR